MQWVPRDLKIRKLVDVDYGPSLSIFITQFNLENEEFLGNIIED